MAVSAITSPYAGAWIDLYVRDARTKVGTFNGFSADQAEQLARELLDAAQAVRAYQAGTVAGAMR